MRAPPDALPRRVIVWRVTQRCTLACRFCAYAVDVQRRRGEADPAEVLRVGALVGEAAGRTGRPALISWIGGEPALWAPLIEVSTALRRWPSLGLSLTTNGEVLRRPAMRDAALELFEELVISVDGAPAFHDLVRRRPGQAALLERLVGELVEARARRGAGPRVEVNTILMRGNIDQFESLAERLRSWGVDGLTFNQLGGLDRPEFFPDNRLQHDQVRAFAEALPAVRARLAARGLRVRGGPGYLRRMLASSAGDAIPVGDCGPGAWFWFINESGLLSPCSYTSYEYELPLTSLSHWEDVEGVEARLRAMREARRSAACADCHCTQVWDKFAG